MRVLTDQNHSMANFKPSMLVLFTNVGNKSPWGISWQIDAAFSLNELLVDVLTCTKVMVDAQCGAGEYNGSEFVGNAAGADACGVASVERVICLSVGMGTGIRHGECGSA